MESDIKTYLEQRKSENPEIVAAYDLQCEIDRLEKTLAEYRAEYNEIMGRLAHDGIKGKFFNITELRPRREVDVDYVREKMPDAYDRCATLPNTAIVEILETTSGGKAPLIQTLKKLDPRKFNECVRINVTDLERCVGKKTLTELDGKAIRTVYHPAKTAKILYIGDKIRIGPGSNEPQEALTE